MYFRGMRKSIYIAGFIGAILLFGACAAKKTIAITNTDISHAAAIFPGATLASLNEGKMHYENNCGKCHGLKNTKSYDEAEWRKIVPDMAIKAKVNAQTEDLILQYVVTMAKP